MCLKQRSSKFDGDWLLRKWNHSAATGWDLLITSDWADVAKLVRVQILSRGSLSWHCVLITGHSLGRGLNVIDAKGCLGKAWCNLPWYLR